MQGPANLYQRSGHRSMAFGSLTSTGQHGQGRLITHGCLRRAVSPSCAKEHSFQSCTNCLLHGTTCTTCHTSTQV